MWKRTEKSKRPRKQSKKETGFTLLLLSNSEKKPVQFQLPPLFFKGLLTVVLLLLGLTGYGLISAALLKPVARQKAALEQEIALLKVEQDKIRSENQNLKAYTEQQDKEMQNLQEVSDEIKSNIENLQGRDSEIRGKLGLSENPPASSGNASQQGQTPVGTAQSTAELQPLALGDAGEGEEYNKLDGSAAEVILQRESSVQLSVMMGARQRGNTMQLAAELQRAQALVSLTSENYDEYEGVVASQEFQAQQRAERAQQRRQTVIGYALSFLGGRYVYGGENPYSGTDCSGFTRYILSHAGGVYINRTAAEQAQQGREVSIEEAKPGDLIFYSNGSRVNHVAMYIGDGRVVHASNERNGIMVSRWNYRTPVHIRNILGE
ncbi:NlpC/P60 family protein [Stomatobaculum longum]|jgi:putative cell wall-associated hydrolase|uniref:NlpC/P60 family protein n=1 Tax=Stomatobaculum longum TaxID=796942 RepID=UPI0028EEBA24|nr:NlpC/P60 family protein [Stomatobaculum longum]